MDTHTLLTQSAYETGIYKNGNDLTVLLTPEGTTYEDGWTKKQPFIQADYKEGYEPFIRVMFFDGMFINVRDYPEHYDSFKKMVLRIAEKV